MKLLPLVVAPIALPLDPVKEMPVAVVPNPLLENCPETVIVVGIAGVVVMVVDTVKVWAGGGGGAREYPIPNPITSTTIATAMVATPLIPLLRVCVSNAKFTSSVVIY